jgi:hypothetical protein
VRNERILYKNKILKWVIERQQICEECLQARHNMLVSEEDRFFLFRDRFLIHQLNGEIAGYKSELSVLQKIQSLLVM